MYPFRMQLCCITIFQSFELLPNFLSISPVSTEQLTIMATKGKDEMIVLVAVMLIGASMESASAGKHFDSIS